MIIKCYDSGLSRVFTKKKKRGKGKLVQISPQRRLTNLTCKEKQRRLIGQRNRKNMPAVEMSQLPGTENSGMKKRQFEKKKPISFLECCPRSSAELIILQNIQPSNPV